MASSSSLYLQTFNPLSKDVRATKPSSSLRSRRNGTSIIAMRREAHNQNSRGRMVDESMIVLRKRIHEMKMMESESDVVVPKEWMEWEKRVYLSYDAVICDAMGHLQSFFMETRPSVALGMVALVALSVPTSTALVLYNFMSLFSGPSF